MSTALAPVIIDTAEDVPDIVVVIDELVVRRVSDLLARAESLPEISVDTLEEVDAFAGECRSVAKAIEAQRVAVKAGPLDLCRKIDDAAKRLGGPLTEIERRLTRGITDVQLEAKRQREEADRKRQAAERERVERERSLAELARTAAPADVAALVELREESKRESAEAWVGALRETPRDLPKTNAHVAMIDELEIFDAEAVPLEVNGIRCRTFDEAAIRRLLKANVPVPGCRMVKVPSARRRGR